MFDIDLVLLMSVSLVVLVMVLMVVFLCTDLLDTCTGDRLEKQFAFRILTNLDDIIKVDRVI